jgi:hypothetical protein
MNPAFRIIALCIGVLLLATPTAFGCAGPAMMAADCPMVEMAGMAGSMAGPSCHETDRMAEDCCDVEPAPEPVQAPSFETVKLFVALEAMDRSTMATVIPPVQPLNRVAAGSFSECDVGRYTLFSSFLL